MKTHTFLRPLSLLVLTATVAFAQKEASLPTLAPLVDSVKSAVVNVDVQKRASDDQRELLERFARRGQHDELSPGTGSGFIIDPHGLLLTNNHVVEGAVTIRVRLDDGRSIDGEVVGRDPLTDVALVKLKGKFDTLPSVKLGDSASLKVGDWAMAIGNPFGLAQSVSLGIISALDRQLTGSRFEQFLQTDAAINPGNSGGPLFNLKGEVIGMNTAIIGAATGIGFAVPSNLIKSLLPQLQGQGYVTRGWLGVSVQDLTVPLGRYLGVPEGALITSVTENSPAQKAGLKDDDVITALDGEKVATSSALTRLVAQKRPDSVVVVSLVRGGKTIELKVKLGVRPDLENVGDLERDKPGQAPDSSSHKRLGLTFQEFDVRMAEANGLPKQGIMVVDVTPGSPAENAGLRRGQVITELNRRPVKTGADFVAALKELKTGAVAVLRVATPGSTGRALVAIELP